LVRPCPNGTLSGPFSQRWTDQSARVSVASKVLTRKRKRTFDETVALAAIRGTFWDRGYAATSLDDIMQATGLGKGSLYAAFGNKRRMFALALRQYCSGLVWDAKRSLQGPDAGTMRRLDTYLRRMSEVFTSSKRGCLLSKAVAEVVGEDDEADGIILGCFREYEHVLAEALTQAKRAGETRPDLNVRQSANLLMAVIRGMEGMGKAGVSASTLNGVIKSAMDSIAA
jgi:TetR/AcrR family transcriptional repressor of nem operon